MDVLKDTKLYRGMGCKKCNNSGFRDRTGLYEVIEIDQDLKELIGQRRPVNELVQHLRAKNVKTLSECCRTKVLAGEVPVEEYIMINMGS
jgi:type IV pilus assembly protein PilB